MKKFLVLVSLFAIGLTSCSKDDDSSNGGGGSAALEGSWRYTMEGHKVGGEEFLETYIHNCDANKDYVRFNSGGTMSDYWYDIDCNEDVSTGTWSKSGNTITATMGGESTTATITELTSTTLKVEFPDGGITTVQVYTKM